jgi:predicted alpha/beta-fold hydrolase
MNPGATINLNNLDSAQSILARAHALFATKPFSPHSLFRRGHAQTLAAFAWPRGFRFHSEKDEERYFPVATDVKVLAHCCWQTDRRQHPTIVIWHGIEGSSASVYMLAMAEKGFRAGFNIVRMNFRNCGGTEHLTPTLYHGGLTEDLRFVIAELIEKDQLTNMVVVGFSLGGNLVIKLAGEYGDDPPQEIVGIAAVSPSVDLTSSADLILKRSNWLYQQDFVRRLKNRIRTKQRLFPALYDTSGLRQIRTLREFDERYTAPANGFRDAEDYYYRASSLRVAARIRIPTLIIHAEDDPFIPIAPLRDSAFADNPYILLVAPKHGGHVAFISETLNGDEDRFWAENRVLEFCKLAAARDENSALAS